MRRITTDAAVRCSANKKNGDEKEKTAHVRSVQERPNHLVREPADECVFIVRQRMCVCVCVFMGSGRLCHHAVCNGPFRSAVMKPP